MHFYVSHFTSKCSAKVKQHYLLSVGTNISQFSDTKNNLGVLPDDASEIVFQFKSDSWLISGADDQAL